MSQSRPGFAALQALTLAWARGDALGRRGLMAVRLGVAAMLAESLTADELSRLSVKLFGALWTPQMAGEGLRDWELRWFERVLPPAPARIFLGGAGSGREVVWLRQHGYHVDACEPAAELAAGLAQVVAPGAHALVATYEDLSRAILDGAGGVGAPLVGQRYDAVVLGWASLTHVISLAERERTLRAMTRLTDGPILASFWMRDDQVMAAERTRATRLGRKLGRRLGRLRLGAGGSIGEPSAFGHAFTRDEIEHLAQAAGRKLRWESGPAEYPHVTFLPA